MLRAPQGVTIAEIVAANGWQAHTVRGAFAGALKKLGLTLISEKVRNAIEPFRSDNSVTIGRGANLPASPTASGRLAFAGERCGKLHLLQRELRRHDGAEGRGRRRGARGRVRQGVRPFEPERGRRQRPEQQHPI